MLMWSFWKVALNPGERYYKQSLYTFNIARFISFVSEKSGINTGFDLLLTNDCCAVVLS